MNNCEEVILKDGSKILIFRYMIEDYKKVVEMFASFSDEALKWTLPPYGRETITRWTQNLENSIILVAHFQDRTVGYCMFGGSPCPRYKGIRDLVICTHQDFQNKGLGTAIMSMVVKLEKEQGLHRIGLEIVADNKKAIHVYEKVGFKIEGIRREAYYGEDEKYHDMVVMGLLL